MKPLRTRRPERGALRARSAGPAQAKAINN